MSELRANLRELNPCSSVRLIIAFVLLLVTESIVFVASNILRNLLVVSLVILFLRSLVTTSPSGNLFANVVASGGLASTVSYTHLRAHET